MNENCKAPEGFEIALFDLDGEPDFDYAGLTINEEEFIFFVKDKIPKLPLKNTGEIWNVLYDTPIKYAIDADNQCWMNDRDDSSLYQVSRENFLFESKDEREKNNFRRILGLDIPMPQWAQIAIKAGFIPPADWTWEK